LKSIYAGASSSKVKKNTSHSRSNPR